MDPILSSDFPAPCSREQLRTDVLSLYLYQMRALALLCSSDVASRLAELEGISLEALVDPSISDAELGMAPDHICKTAFCQAMEALYDFACFGILDGNAEPLIPGSIYTWIAAIVDDMAQSAFLNEYDLHGREAFGEARRVQKVVELANARSVLEGEGLFFIPMGGERSEESDDTSLSVRQMALLAGMEEMSIRAAANPKRATPLLTFKDAQGRTRIALDVAKDWLKAKQRYVPVTRKWSASEVDLTRTRFSNTTDLALMIEARLQTLADRAGNNAILFEQLAAIGSKPRATGTALLRVELEPADFANAELMARLGEIVSLSPQLLTLRAREAYLLESLAELNREVRDAIKA